MGEANLIDLDAVLRPDIRVKLNSVTYRLPGDPPSEILLSIGMLLGQLEGLGEGDSAERALELREEMGDRVHELFCERQPELEPGTIRLSDPQLIELVNKLMAIYREPGEAVERPTSAQRTKSAPRSRARSARSSRSPSSTSSPT